MDAADLRTRDIDFANLELQTIWPGTDDKTSSWPGLAVLVALLRVIYCQIPTDERATELAREQESANPILRLAWLAIESPPSSEYLRLWDRIHDLFGSKAGEPEPSCLDLMESDAMLSTFWSRPEFLLYQTRARRLSEPSGEWVEVRSHEPPNVAKHSLVRYDGSKPLGECVSQLFGCFRNDAGNLLTRLSNTPDSLRVLYTPTTSQAARFKDLVEFQLNSLQWRENEERTGYTLQEERERYVLMAAVRLRPTDSASDFFRAFSLAGGAVVPLAESAIIDRVWRIGRPGSSYILVYASSGMPFRRPVEQMEEVRALDPNIPLYKADRNLLGDSVLDLDDSDAPLLPHGAVDPSSVPEHTTAATAAGQSLLAPSGNVGVREEPSHDGEGGHQDDHEMPDAPEFTGWAPNPGGGPFVHPSRMSAHGGGPSGPYTGYGQASGSLPPYQEAYSDYSNYGDYGNAWKPHEQRWNPQHPGPAQAFFSQPPRYPGYPYGNPQPQGYSYPAGQQPRGHGHGGPPADFFGGYHTGERRPPPVGPQHRTPGPTDDSLWQEEGLFGSIVGRVAPYDDMGPDRSNGATGTGPGARTASRGPHRPRNRNRQSRNPNMTPIGGRNRPRRDRR
ncbi:hypothetical protein F4779DRAFT_326853 [Xylariaceae sp. FL0662B]|nr:hypothetical protein F4779DRAFT_326853 [Xylariaceae sp. FL0662B]